MSANLAARHWHQCEECGRSWECFTPGGCRDEREKDCAYCDDEGEDDDEEDGE